MLTQEMIELFTIKNSTEEGSAKRHSRKRTAGVIESEIVKKKKKG